MHWQEESDGFAEFVIEGLVLGNTAICFAKVCDRVDQLFAEERAELSQMARKRKAAFSTGRWCAHRAQEALGGTSSAIKRVKRVPLWPAGISGSITHTDVYAGAVVSSDQAVGVDLEQLDRLHDGLHKTLFTEKERLLLDEYRPGADTIMFSAKEAGYKAVFPIGQAFIGFHEAEIALDENSQTFVIDYVGNHEPNNVFSRGVGYWRIAYNHVFTLFVIG